ncbi:NADP-dependent malic enzyme [Candidatus Micrarchaeota archaeon]|nr:NADP-dependent malic enzyme [Candidatus Micrarchaeota archaeon]
MDIGNQSLEFHRRLGGKLRTCSKAPIKDRHALSLAYTPGVAAVCNEVKNNPSSAYALTLKGNSVAIVSDGTRVLGLGDIGPLAAIPVMEGKAALLCEFAKIDAFPICLATKDKDEIIRTVRLISPCFGAILLEDIESPKCFEVEATLKKTLGIPVFHDDQHGTAVVVLAALINALKVTGRDAKSAKVVVNGAGAAGIAISKLLTEYGIKNLVVLDSKGAICSARSDLEQYKKEFGAVLPHMACGKLSDVIKSADVFIGASVAGALKQEQAKAMGENPIIFALSNPVPEITHEDAKAAGCKIYASARSDLDNQVNNVLAFPGIFRGALDCRAKQITEGMKLAAALAIARFAQERGLKENYIVPAAFEEGLHKFVAQKVVEAARKEGVAQI